MRIVTKRIKVVEMSEEEMRKFVETVQRAQCGSLVHYAETQLDDGSYLGVQVKPNVVLGEESYRGR